MLVSRNVTVSSSSFASRFPVDVEKELRRRLDERLEFFNLTTDARTNYVLHYTEREGRLVLELTAEGCIQQPPVPMLPLAG